MWEEILSLAVSNGLWAVLFCILLFYVLSDTKKREEKYTTMISALSKKLDIVEEIKEDTEKILSRTKEKKCVAKSKVSKDATANLQAVAAGSSVAQSV